MLSMLKYERHRTTPPEKKALAATGIDWYGFQKATGIDGDNRIY
jgi:hypothetical protein